MNCVFWNPRGIQAPGRKTALIDLFSKTHAHYVGFQETKKESISCNYLNSLVVNRMFDWKDLPAVGSAGGIVVGVDLDFFEVISWQVLKFSVSVVVRLKAKDTIIRNVTVYGSSYEDKKEDFISKLHGLFVDYCGHTIIGEGL
jgi:hypothetical protein